MGIYIIVDVTSFRLRARDKAEAVCRTQALERSVIDRVGDIQWKKRVIYKRERDRISRASSSSSSDIDTPSNRLYIRRGEADDYIE